MDCEDIFKYILSYLSNYNVITISILSKKINKFVKNYLNLEIIDDNLNNAYDTIKIYNNFKLHLIYCGEDKYNYKFDYIKNNIIGLVCKKSVPQIDMKNLEYLKMDIKQINEIKFQFKKLKHVSINYENYSYNYNKTSSNLDLSLLKNLNNIESLKLDLITMSLPLADFVNLKKLHCYNCSSIKNENIKNLINLESFVLYDNKNVSDIAFKNLNKIKTLILYKTNITLNVLQYLPDIECWSPDNYKNDDNIEHLKNVKKLKLLDLSTNDNINDENIKNIEIEFIVLSKNITINGLNKSIKKLDLSKNKKIQDKDLRKLKLEYLDLCSNSTISDKGLKYCKNLKFLNLAFNEKITDFGLIELRNLEYLNLMMINFDNPYPMFSNITDKSLKKLKKLKYLNLEYNGNITDEAIKLLVNLEYLNISNNKKISINGLSNLKNLKELNCYNSLLSEKDLLILIKNNRNIKIVSTICCFYGKIPKIFYSKDRYFKDNNDEYMRYFCKNVW